MQEIMLFVCRCNVLLGLFHLESPNLHIYTPHGTMTILVQFGVKRSKVKCTGHWNNKTVSRLLCINLFASTCDEVLLTFNHSLYVPLKNFSLIWRRHRAAKFRPTLGVQGLWAGKDLYRATHTVTRGLGISGLVRTAPIQSPFTTHTGMWRTYSNPGPHGSSFIRLLRHVRGYAEDIFLPRSLPV
jgi:hypothetical protein